MTNVTGLVERLRRVQRLMMDRKVGRQVVQAPTGIRLAQPRQSPQVTPYKRTEDHRLRASHIL